MSGALAAKARALPAWWTYHHDNRLRDAACWRDLAALSDEWGIASAALTARWHRLRHGQVPKAEAAPEARAHPALAAVDGRVSPRMARILAVIAALGEANYKQLEAETGICVDNVRGVLGKNAAALAEAGWAVVDHAPGRGRPARLRLERLAREDAVAAATEASSGPVRPPTPADLEGLDGVLAPVEAAVARLVGGPERPTAAALAAHLGMAVQNVHQTLNRLDRKLPARGLRLARDGAGKNGDPFRYRLECLAPEVAAE